MKRAALTLLTTAVLFMLSACAPTAFVKPIPADTRPVRVVELLRQKEAGLDGLRAFVNISIKVKGEQPKSFDAVLYIRRPDKVRLTGISFLGATAFDAVLVDGGYRFVQSALGQVMSGPRDEFRGFLESMGVEVDPDAISLALLSSPPEGIYRDLVEKTGDGYSHYLLADSGGVLTPVVRADYDLGLNLLEKTFYDKNAGEYMRAGFDGSIAVDGYDLPETITADETLTGNRIVVRFEKYLVNPEGIEDDFNPPGL